MSNKLSRRQILKMTCGFVAGATVVTLPSYVSAQGYFRKQHRAFRKKIQNLTPHEKVVYGETEPFFNGTARTWVSLYDNDHPLAIGITFTEAALSGLPTTYSGPSGMPSRNFPDNNEYVFPSPLLENEHLFLFPQAASTTAFNHIGFNWNPQGHSPFEVYGVPHFDIHFYTISPEERLPITETGDDTANLLVYKMPPPELIPSGYYLPPGTGAMETEGWHAVDPTSAEFQGKNFDKTFICGFYNGDQVFWEPMITKAFFETKPNTTDALKLPAAYPKSGYYPTSYSVNYDATSKEYTVSLNGLTYRSANPTSVP